MHVLSADIVTWMKLPSLLMEMTASVRSIDFQTEERLVQALVRTPGRLYGVDCDTAAPTQAEAGALFAHWLPTFRSIMGSVIANPQPRR